MGQYLDFNRKLCFRKRCEKVAGNDRGKFACAAEVGGEADDADEEKISPP